MVAFLPTILERPPSLRQGSVSSLLPGRRSRLTEFAEEWSEERSRDQYRHCDIQRRCHILTPGSCVGDFDKSFTSSQHIPLNEQPALRKHASSLPLLVDNTVDDWLHVGQSTRQTFSNMPHGWLNSNCKMDRFGGPDLHMEWNCGE